MVANKNRKEMVGNHIIFDLNGHRITSGNGDGVNYYICIYETQVLEFTDTSAVGGGYIYSIIGANIPKLIFSGNGSYNTESGSASTSEVVIRGGQRVQVFNYSSTGNTTYQRVVAPYMQLSSDNGRTMIYTPRSDAFAVADNETVAGVYNYEFGHLWDLRVGELYGLTVPDDKTYYLFGRNAGGAYGYLNIVYRDGQWVAA